MFFFLKPRRHFLPVHVAGTGTGAGFLDSAGIVRSEGFSLAVTPLLRVAVRHTRRRGNEVRNTNPGRRCSVWDGNGFGSDVLRSNRHAGHGDASDVHCIIPRFVVPGGGSGDIGSVTDAVIRSAPCFEGFGVSDIRKRSRGEGSSGCGRFSEIGGTETDFEGGGGDAFRAVP